jgi:outer membrane biosynthesis protein TonB
VLCSTESPVSLETLMRCLLPSIAFALVACGSTPIPASPVPPGGNDNAAVPHTTNQGGLEATGASPFQGSLPREVIRQVIRANLNAVRACYERGLATEGNLSGRVVVSFIIDADGHVHMASVASSTMTPSGSTTDTMQRCICDAVRAFIFPRPNDGGAVLVNYPFVLDSQPE